MQPSATGSGCESECSFAMPVFRLPLLFLGASGLMICCEAECLFAMPVFRLLLPFLGVSGLIILGMYS